MPDTGIALCMVVDLVSVELDRVHERIAGRLTRAKPRARVRKYLSGLVPGVERKNGRRRCPFTGSGLSGVSERHADVARCLIL